MKILAIFRRKTLYWWGFSGPWDDWAVLHLCPQGVNVNKAELVAELADQTDTSKAAAAAAIDALFSEKGIIATELKKGEKVQITGFGNFEARKRAARTGRNPRTGGVIQIKASTVPAFRPGKALKEVVNR